MKIYRSTDPASDPVTSALVEERLALESGFDSNVIAELIEEATTQLEYDTGLSVMQQTWTLTLDKFPSRDTIWLPRGPLDTTADGIESFTYTDTSGGSNTLVENTDFRKSVAGNQTRLVPISNWPVDVADADEYPDPIKIVYDTGASAAKGWQITAILTRIHYMYTLGQVDSMKAYWSAIKKHKDYTDYRSLNA